MMIGFVIFLLFGLVMFILGYQIGKQECDWIKMPPPSSPEDEGWWI